MGKLQDDGLAGKFAGGSSTNNSVAEGSKEVNGPVVELADTDALRASDESHGGSSPSRPTTYVQWAKDMPKSERNVEIGQRRFYYFDGYGLLDVVVCFIAEDSITVQPSGWACSNEMPWEYLGIIINGTEHKLILEDEEREALECPEPESI